MAGSNSKRSKTIMWIVVAVIALWWIILAAKLTFWHFILNIVLGFASAAIGCVIGFLFTSYGEESGTVGKIRDWLIGGLAGLTLAKAGSIKSLLITFAAGPGPQEFAVVCGTAISFAVLGFFSMFFQRELILNVLLAESRATRGQIEGTRQAGIAVLRLLTALPPSVQSGLADIDQLVQVPTTETAQLKALLDSSEVYGYLTDADDALKAGRELEWNTVATVANLHYYRTYFESDQDNKREEANRAATWILRALTMNPMHVDLTAKYADMLSINERYEEATVILERIIAGPLTPPLFKEWLACYLVHLPTRLDDAIRYAESYHDQFPTETDTAFVLAYAYAKKYGEELLTRGIGENNSENRKRALNKLREGLIAQPMFGDIVRTKWVAPGGPCESLVHDPEFRSIAELPPE